MIIRNLTREEFDERIAISEFAFQFKLPPEQKELDRAAFRPERHWGAFDEAGKLLSALILIPFEAWVHGRPLKMGGVAGVATWPEARRGGVVASLLTHSLQIMREQGQTLSMLHPFSFPFYRKFGWEWTVERKRYEIETALLPKRKDVSGRFERVPKEAERLRELYRTFASRYNGTLNRSDNRWANVLKRDGLVAVWRGDDGEPGAYVFYEVNDRLLTVHDWACLNEEARRALWSFLANHDSMADRVAIVVPTDDALPYLLPDPRFKQELVPYFMSRIVDVAAFLELYAFRPAASEERLLVQVEDAYAPWNDGGFLVTLAADGTASVARAEGETAAQALPRASLDIRALTGMLLGNRRPVWLREAGLLRGDAVELLERRLPSRPAYLADFF